MITIQDAKEILYQVKHHTGIRFNESEKDSINLLLTLGRFYDISKDKILEHCILSVHEFSVKQKFNWNWD